MGLLGVKKVPLFVATAILVLLLGATLSGCAGNDKAGAEACITDALDTARTATSADAAPPNLLPGNASKYRDIDVSGVLAAYYSKFSYSVDEVTVDGDKARAQVSASLITLDQCIDMQKSALSTVQGSPASTNDWTCQSDDEYPDLEKCVAAYEPLLEGATPKTVSVSVDLKKFNGKWEVDSPYRSIGGTDAQALIFLLQTAS